MTKIRWSRSKTGVDEMTARQEGKQHLEDPLLEEEQKILEALEIDMRDVMSEDGSRVDMRKKRPTDMKNNRQVHMPAPAPAQVEAEYNTRLHTWQKEFMIHRMSQCDENGALRANNLTVRQQLGLKSLTRKVARMELMVLEADKGKSFVVVDEATYLEMSKDHIDKDVPTCDKEVRQSQRLLTTTAKAFTTVLGMGKSHSDRAYARCVDNSGSEAEDVPWVKFLPKTHKAVQPGGHPQSRPVVSAATGLFSRAGDIIADYLEPLVQTTVPRYEDISTEEVLAQLGKAETSVRDNGLTDTMVGSLDVKSLYPSLNQEASAEAVEKFILESKVETDRVDWRAAQMYLASNLT